MTSYLSLVPVRLLRRPGFQDDADARHREVMSIFGALTGPNPRQTHGILFRLESLPGQEPAYLIRSRVLPENLPLPAPAPKIESERRLENGVPVNFRVALNAVYRQQDGKTRKVEVKDGELEAWLSRKLGAFFTDIQLINHQREVLGANRNGRRNGVEKVIQVDVFDGVARVSDGEALAAALAEGVGRAKSYGCGLLTVQQL